MKLTYGEIDASHQ